MEKACLFHNFLINAAINPPPLFVYMDQGLRRSEPARGECWPTGLRRSHSDLR